MNRWAFGGLLVLVGLMGSFTAAQEDKPKKIQWKHGLTFKVRKAGEVAFTETTKKFGAEAFLDRDVNRLLFITESGTIGLGSAAKLEDGQDVKAPLLYHALEVKVRPAGKASFDDAKKVSTEVFKDPNSDNLIYISESGWAAVAPAGGIAAPDKTIKDPVWYHGLDLKVRKAGEKEFSDATKKLSLEVYKDENTNHLFYISDSGAVAVVSAAGVGKPADGKVAAPVWYHAFEVKVRNAKEEKFTKDTKAIGVEVYKDENANMLVYVSETGGIAVVPAAGLGKPSSSKEPDWKFGRNFSARKADEKNFTDKTQEFGAEVYKDETSGNLVYVSENGSIAVIPGK